MSCRMKEFVRQKQQVKIAEGWCLFAQLLEVKAGQFELLERKLLHGKQLRLARLHVFNVVACTRQNCSLVFLVFPANA